MSIALPNQERAQRVVYPALYIDKKLNVEHNCLHQHISITTEPMFPFTNNPIKRGDLAPRLGDITPAPWLLAALCARTIPITITHRADHRPLGHILSEAGDTHVSTHTTHTQAIWSLVCRTRVALWRGAVATLRSVAMCARMGRVDETQRQSCASIASTTTWVLVRNQQRNR